MRQRDLSLAALHANRLSVKQGRVASRGIPRMTNGKRAGNTSQCIGGEDVRDQAHGLVQLKTLAIGRGDSGRFLPAMLQRIEAEVSEETVMGKVGRISVSGPLAPKH